MSSTFGLPQREPQGMSNRFENKPFAEALKPLKFAEKVMTRAEFYALSPEHQAHALETVMFMPESSEEFDLLTPEAKQVIENWILTQGDTGGIVELWKANNSGFMVIGYDFAAKRLKKFKVHGDKEGAEIWIENNKDGFASDYECMVVQANAIGDVIVGTRRGTQRVARFVRPKARGNGLQLDRGSLARLGMGGSSAGRWGDR